MASKNVRRYSVEYKGAYLRVSDIVLLKNALRRRVAMSARHSRVLMPSRPVSL